MYHFKAKTLSSFSSFQIKILRFGDKFIALIVRWILEILACYFLYKWKSKHAAPAASSNINAAVGNGSVNECIIQPWYAKFETGVSQTKRQTRDCCGQWSFTSNSLKKSRQYCYKLCRRIRRTYYNHFTSSNIDWQSLK